MSPGSGPESSSETLRRYETFLATRATTRPTITTCASAITTALRSSAFIMVTLCTDDTRRSSTSATNSYRAQQFAIYRVEYPSRCSLAPKRLRGSRTISLHSG